MMTKLLTFTLKCYI